MCEAPYGSLCKLSFHESFYLSGGKMYMLFLEGETLNGTELMWYVRLLLLVSQEDK